MKSGMKAMRKRAVGLAGLAAIMLAAVGCGGGGIGSDWTYEGTDFTHVFNLDRDDEGTVYKLKEGQRRVEVLQVLDDGCLAKADGYDRCVYVETPPAPYLDGFPLRGGYYIRRGKFKCENEGGASATLARYVEVTRKSSLKVIRECETAAWAALALASQMVDIPGGKFKLCKYEVTQALWEAVMGSNPSEFKGPDRPVENVSWNDCQEFIEKLNALPKVKASRLTYRLPTEEEWEYACRAGSTGDYCKLADGTEITERMLGRVAWYGYNGDFGTHPVGQKEPNAFGLYDMHGNVEEWTATDDGGHRVARGGCWGRSANFCLAVNRLRDYPAYRNNDLGFRLAAEGL